MRLYKTMEALRLAIDLLKKVDARWQGSNINLSGLVILECYHLVAHCIVYLIIALSRRT